MLSVHIEAVESHNKWQSTLVVYEPTISSKKKKTTPQAERLLMPTVSKCFSTVTNQGWAQLHNMKTESIQQLTGEDEQRRELNFATGIYNNNNDFKDLIDPLGEVDVEQLPDSTCQS